MTERIPDHMPDRYGAVVLVGAPPHTVPSEELVDHLLATGCGDCNVNLTLYWRPDLESSTGSPWFAEFAHDDTCPSFARLEREGRLGSVPPKESSDG